MAFEPTQFGKYTLYEKLAVGGMALIYRARIQGVKGFQKDLVIKQILPQYSGMNDFIDMFIDEAKIAVNLNHANIVPVYELGEIDGQLYIAMEYVAGRDLQSILEACEEKEVVVPPRFAAYVMTGVCRGLDYAHNKKDDATRQPLNIIHRDISPNNVIVSYEGEVKIIDFGIAKASIKVSVTQFGTLKGKMIYMSPEQAAEQKLDPRSDVFSAGILLYELVTGEKPYGGDNFAVTQESVKKASFRPPEEINPSLPPVVCSIIRKSMARDPADRFASAFEFERALSDFLFSTGENVYARDVARFMEEIFGDGPVTTGEPPASAASPGAPKQGRGAGERVPTVTNIRNLNTAGSRTPQTPPAEAPTPAAPSGGNEVLPSSPAENEVSLGAPLRSFTPTADATAVRFGDADSGAASTPIPDSFPSDMPDEGPAIEEEDVDSDERTADPVAPTASLKEAPRAVLDGDAFAFEIPPPGSQDQTSSQRDTVVTRLPDSRTAAPASNRKGVVPAVSRGRDPTRTSSSTGHPVARGAATGKPVDAPSWLDVTSSEPKREDTDKPGVVPGQDLDEETAPGASAISEATPVSFAPGSRADAGASRPRADGVQRAPLKTPASDGAVRRPAPSNPRAVPPPAPSPPRGTPIPPWSTKENTAGPPGPGGMRGLLNRVIGGKPVPLAPPTQEVLLLEGFYDSPHEFLTNAYATYGDRRGLFLATVQIEVKLGVDLPVEVAFRAPQANFRVHGRVIWRRAKEATTKGKRLPAGLAIEFVEGLDDDLEALFAYLGLP